MHRTSSFTRWTCAILVLFVSLATRAAEEAPHVVVASTTSTENSGLFAHLLPTFRERTGIDVRVVAVGTGQAIRLAERGDADVLFVHHLASELAFVEAGHGLARHPVMYNDFVLVGPAADPAGVRGMSGAAAALARIAQAEVPFVSRGDDSGTHKKELELWEAAGIDAGAGSGGWYREVGSGMGATLNTASGLGAYVLSDRGTWLGFANKSDLEVLVERDPRLFNPYGVILVNPERHPHVRVAEGRAFVAWLISREGQEAIGSFRIAGEQAFFPNATSGDASP